MSEPHTDGALGITKGRVGWMNTSTWSIFWSGARKAESNSGSPRGEASCFHYLHQAFLPSTAVPYLCNTQCHCSRSAQSQRPVPYTVYFLLLFLLPLSKNTGYSDLQSLWLGLLREDTVLCYSSLRNLPLCVDDMYTRMFFSWRFPESYLCDIRGDNVFCLVLFCLLGWGNSGEDRYWASVPPIRLV